MVDRVYIVPTRITEVSENVTLKEGQTKASLRCAAETDVSSRLNVTWRRDDNEMVAVDVFTMNVELDVGADTTVIYICNASDGLSFDSRRITVKRMIVHELRYGGVLKAVLLSSLDRTQTSMSFISVLEIIETGSIIYIYIYIELYNNYIYIKTID